MSNNADTAIQSIALLDNYEDLKRVNEALKDAYDRVRRAGVREFSIGDTVEFDSKDGSTYRGKVVKRNRKTLGVDVTHIDGDELPFSRSWRVDGSLLRSA